MPLKILIILFSCLSFLVNAKEPSLLKQEPITPINKDTNLNIQKVLLGEKLFFDKRLSHDNTLSCSSCHNLNLGGADAQQFSTGINAQKGSVNSPTVFNAHYNLAQFWDGRAITLEQQALGLVQNPIEMGSSWTEVVSKLSQDEQLKQEFKQIYKGDITSATITDAIAEYERSLVTVNAPFDQYLLNHPQAISEQAKQGYALFKSYGCISCHQGVNVGGNMFHKLGILNNLQSMSEDQLLSNNLGRFNVTNNPMDKYVFKVPSLRLVTQTAPYFHDGSIKTLKEAVQKMALYQLLREIPEKDIDLIIQFLESLVGNYERVSL